MNDIFTKFALSKYFIFEKLINIGVIYSETRLNNML